MASIVKRKSKYSVVYDYTDENGKRRQRWETFSTNAEAKKRKKQIEYEQDSGTFFIPTAKTLNDLLDEYMSIYGVNTWAMSTYESRRGLARNYITPIIGDMLLSDMPQCFSCCLLIYSVDCKLIKLHRHHPPSYSDNNSDPENSSICLRSAVIFQL